MKATLGEARAQKGPQCHTCMDRKVIFHKYLTIHSIRTLDEIMCPYKMMNVMKCAPHVASKSIIFTSNFMTKIKHTDKMMIPYA
jgi:hypothetical protein